MDGKSSTEASIDSIDVTIFEDFYQFDITLPFIADPVSPKEKVISNGSAKSSGSPIKVHESLECTPCKLSVIQELSPEKLPIDDPDATLSTNYEFTVPFEQTFSVFSHNPYSSKTPSANKQPLIVFSPAVVPQTPKSICMEPTFSPVNESIETKENQATETNEQIRPETPEMDKTLVLKQIFSRTNQSPLYTPVTAMVSRFRNLALETPLLESKKSNFNQNQTPQMSKEVTPLSTIQHQTRLEKLRLVSPLLRSPKLRPLVTKHPTRSSSKVENPSMKKSPTASQYKANPPVIQGSRIPVLKLN